MIFAHCCTNASRFPLGVSLNSRPVGLRFCRGARSRSSVADQMALHQRGSLTVLSRFHPQPLLPVAPMDHGYAVDVAHLLFTASADSHDTQRRRRRRRGTGLHRLNEQWDSPETCGEKQSLNARPYNRNRVSLNRARGRGVYICNFGWPRAFRSHKSFLRGSFSIRIDAISLRNYYRSVIMLANRPHRILGQRRKNMAVSFEQNSSSFPFVKQLND